MMPNYDYSKDLTSDNKNGLVYVIDDDADVRESIKWLLESTDSLNCALRIMKAVKPSSLSSTSRYLLLFCATCACPACRVQMCKII